MIKKHTEQRFEDAIVAELIKDGGCAFVNYNHKSGKSYCFAPSGSVGLLRDHCSIWESPDDRDSPTPVQLEVDVT
jgi:hypothetical protein